ncbi:hypothetical protein LOTGIDRAFT_213342 [Lottia gigantea]|uniref:SSD domain-containing protein n=1 Tax=Lottia gigantea TaxID=225164 RepID=V4AW36_LOTGI|nr:hypothetical protein LOTGIDRAFT_213342 [Lottia gigantea]ESO99305.1 hypothetical protein LOTGIDRAFT_213342 [Lottia gigantea]
MASQHNKCIGNCFNKYGRIIANNPWWFIIIPVIICGLFGIGLIKLTSESDIETLYVPINSQSEEDRRTVEKLFPDKSDSNYFVQSLARLNMYGDIIFKSKNGGNALRLDVIDEIRSVVSKVKEFTINYNGTDINYSHVCAVLGGQCFITGEYILHPNFLTLFETEDITYPIWRTINGTQEDVSKSMNGISKNGTLQSVITIKIIFNLRQTDVAMSKIWEEKFVTEMSNLTTNLTDFVFSTSTSLDKELSANTGQDITSFSLSFTALIVYASFVASSGNCVANRSHLARAGVMGVAFAILAAFGLCAPIVNFVDIVGVMPFLALGVGIDCMFVIMSEWAEHYDETSVEDQMGATLEKCGGSISIASLTDIIAFLIGVSSSFISIRNFCVYTAMALFFSFVLHLTFFLGCLAIHGKRVRDRRHCVTCQKINEDHKCKNEWKVPTKREDDESLCEKLPQLLLRISISTPIIIVVKIVIIILFLGYLGASGWGIYNLRQGLLLSNLVHEKSYFYSYQIWSRENYQMVLSISVVFKDVDYLDPNQVSGMEKILKIVEDDSMIADGSLICWFNAFKSSVPGFNNDTDRNTFIAQSQSFLSQAIVFSNDVTFMSDGSDILASRCHFITEAIPDSKDQGNLMLRLREITSKSYLNIFPFSAPFIYFEQYVMVLPSTLQTMGIAVACMFVITILFMPHPIMVTLVTLNMFSILAGILGFLYYWDLSLSSITMIHLIMSVGFSVDFSAHVCHGFISSDSVSRHERTKDALRVSAAPILNGGISSLLGICTLIWSQSYVFRSFFKIMVLVITFGLAHSLLLLPVVLSICGPKKTQGKSEDEDVEEEKSHMV